MNETIDKMTLSPDRGAGYPDDISSTELDADSFKEFDHVGTNPTDITDIAAMMRADRPFKKEHKVYGAMGKLELAVADYDLTTAVENASTDVMREFLDKKEDEAKQGHKMMG
jgi:hypothetical protein